MHDGRFQTYESFHRLSGTENTEARMAAYHTLVNSMLISNSRDKALVDVPDQRPRASGQVHSFLE